MKSDLLPVVTKDTFLAACEAAGDNHEHVFETMFETMRQENPLIAHEVSGWVQKMTAAYGTDKIISFLIGPLSVYRLLRAQAESDSVKIKNAFLTERLESDDGSMTREEWRKLAIRLSEERTQFSAVNVTMFGIGVVLGAFGLYAMTLLLPFVKHFVGFHC